MNKIQFIKTLKLAVISVCLIIANKVSAQQVPLYSQFFFNQFLFNPSFAGSGEYGTAYMISRNQWNNMPDAPTTNAFSIDAPIKSQKIGIGLMGYADRAGIFDRTHLQSAYSYKIDFKEDFGLRLGLGLGMLDQRIDYTRVRVVDEDDANIYRDAQRNFSFDANFGASINYKKLSFGVAVPQLMSTNLSYQSGSNPRYFYSLSQHFNGYASYEFDLGANKEHKIKPVVFAQYAAKFGENINRAPLQLDAGAIYYYKNKVWAGAIWRMNNSISGAAGVKLHDKLVIGYAYDFGMSRISSFAGSTQEVLIGITFGTNSVQKAQLEQKENSQITELNKRIDSLSEKAAFDKERIEKLEKENAEISKRLQQLSGDFENFLENLKQAETDEGYIEVTDPNTGKVSRKLKEGYKEERDSLTGEIRVVDPSGKPVSSEAGKAMQGESYMLQNLTFGNEDATLAKSSYSQMNELAEVLKQRPNMVIEIIGHTDSRGDFAYNQELSLNRADAVRDYLIKKGVVPTQIMISGEGETKPIADNRTREGQKLNRRVEMKVIKR